MAEVSCLGWLENIMRNSLIIERERERERERDKISKVQRLSSLLQQKKNPIFFSRSAAQ